MKYKLKNVIYFPSFNSVGGVETFTYEMGLKYGKDYDITVVYKAGDADMMRHIGEVARVIRYREGDEIECDVFIFGYGYDILDKVKAKQYVQTFHADYINRHLNPCMDKRITKRVGVADNTTNGIREHFDWAKDIETIYNPYTVKKPKKVLHLVSATRLTPEKGYDRMIALAEALDEAEIPFRWDIYTDSSRGFPNKNVSILPHRLDVLDFIADADYLVQLSDTEGYSYSIVEALSVGTPVIVTEFPVAEEQGVVDGVTGFILPFDMSEIPVEKIYKGLKKFKYTPRESRYNEILSPGVAKYAPNINDIVKVRCIRPYQDLELGRIMVINDVYEVKRSRADHLADKKFAEMVE